MIADGRRQIAGFGLYLLGLVLAITGYFGPWVGHQTAALTVTGFELAHLTRLQGAPASLAPDLFLTPLVAAAILLGLLPNQATNKLTRHLPTLAAALLLLAALPPYQFIREPQYRGQLALATGGLVLVLLTPLARRLPRRAWAVLVALLPLAGVAPALFQFALLRPLIVALYNRPLSLGWGLVICIAGFALLLAYGILNLYPPTPPETRTPQGYPSVWPRRNR
ncbi:MAG: hypothetical protein SWK90_16550 [Chloroflexota bacterium]|nr:hypothetical protein [Chloroflexota bacterium]